MGVERPPGGRDRADRGDSSTPGKSSDSVHVRRLDMLDTLRWSWEVLGDRRELLAIALGVNLMSVVAALGITRPYPAADPEFADWVMWLYLAQFLVTLVVWGAVYLTAADAVANRSRSVGRHLVTATKRLPALVATAIVMAILVGLSLLPAVAVDEMTAGPGGGLEVGPSLSPVVGLFLTLVLGLVAVYVFFRLLLAYPACVVDHKGPVASARASWRAATRNVRKVVAVSVVYVVVVAVVHVLASVASNVAFDQLGGWYDVTSTLVTAAFNAVLLPVFALALAHLYLEGSRNR